MQIVAPSGDRFEIETDLIEVSSLRRPDPAWRFVDAAGHEHRWYCQGQPMEGYSPSKTYDLPTLRVVVDDPGDDEYPASTHHECLVCGEHVRVGLTADTTRQFMPGLRRCYINGQPVTREDFEARARAAFPNATI